MFLLWILWYCWRGVPGGLRAACGGAPLRQVRCVSIVHLGDERSPATLAEEALTMAKALDWVLRNRARLNITAVNFSMLDNR